MACCYAELAVSSLAVAVPAQRILKLSHCLLASRAKCLCSVCGVVHLRVRKADQSKPHSLEASTSGITYWQIIDESSVVRGTFHHHHHHHYYTRQSMWHDRSRLHVVPTSNQHVRLSSVMNYILTYLFTYLQLVASRMSMLLTTSFSFTTATTL